MSLKIYGSSPYYDDYKESKDYVQILAASGNYGQSRELTQMGTIIRDYLARFGDVLFTEGEIISGCSLDIDLLSLEVTLNPGVVYVDGLMRNIREPITLPITGVGTEVLGFKVAETVITPAMDETLLDPAEATEAYGQAGANRIKQTVSFVKDSEGSTRSFVLNDGVLTTTQEVDPTKNENDLMKKLAQRTYDVSGNFKVEGLYLEDKDNSFLDPTDPDYNKTQVIVGAGKAYINGYSTTKSWYEVIDCDPATTESLCNNEVHKVTTYDTKYYFKCQPASFVKNMKFTVEVLGRGIERGIVQGGSEFLEKNLLEITEVYQGSGSSKITYTPDVDYVIVNNSISWSPLGAEPATGETYYVSYLYNHEAELGTDYLFDSDENGTYFTIAGSSTHKPKVGREMLVDYTFYLSRIDTFTMDSKGNINILKGVPDRDYMCLAPRNNDPEKLVLGYVLFYANSQKKLIKNLYTIRLTQSDIYGLQTRIDDIQDNMAIQSLDREAKEGEDATELKGVYTDGFLGFTKADIWHPEWKGVIDLDQNEFTVGYDMQYQDVGIGVNSDCGIQGRIVSAPYTEVVVFSQPKATRPMLVNPYAVWKDLTVLSIDPAKDTWATSEKVTIGNGTKYGDTMLAAWWAGKAVGTQTVKTSRTSWLETVRDGGVDVVTTTNTTFTTYAALDVKSETVAIVYMRGRKVKFVGMNFYPEEFPIKLEVGGKELTPIIPSSSTSITDQGYTFLVEPKGTFKRVPVGEHMQFHDGTWAEEGKAYMCSDSEGMIEGYYELPDGQFPCGSIDVKVVGAYCLARTPYEASGTHTITTASVRTWQTKSEQREVEYISLQEEDPDPLAQTFSFDKDTIVTGFDFFFAEKDYVRGVLIQVRDVVNGYPGHMIYDSVAIPSSKVKADNTKLVATHVTLNQSLYAQAGVQYSVVIISDSNLYSHWIAELGETDITTLKQVRSNADPDGVLFSSSNSKAWTAHQNADLTYNIYKAQYNREGAIVFDNVSAIQASSIVAAAVSEDQKNAGIEWYLRVNDDREWQQINPYVNTDLTKLATTVDLKCNLHVSENTSPVIAKDMITIAWLLNHTDATYVSRRIETQENFTKLKVSVQLATPDGSNGKVYYQCDDVSDDWILLTNPTVVQANEEFTDYTFEKTLGGAGATHYRVKIVLTSPNPLIKPRARKLRSILKY